jgi:alpha-mannosidase
MAQAADGPVRQAVGKYPSATLERLEKALSTLYFPEHNLSSVRLVRIPPELCRLELVTRAVSHEPAAPRPVPTTDHAFAAGHGGEVTSDWVAGGEACVGPAEPIATGHAFRPSWSTHWVSVSIHKEGAEAAASGRSELVEAFLRDHASHPVVLVWNSNCEAAAWVQGPDGKNNMVCGLTGGGGGEVPEDSDRRAEVPLSVRGLEHWLDGEASSQRLLIEVACNGMFGVGRGGMIRPPDPDQSFALDEAFLAVKDPVGEDLYHSFICAMDLAKHAQTGGMLQARALFAANAALNAFDRRDRKTWLRGLEILAQLFDTTVAPRRAPTVYCLGHCHIDTAWLWPIAETVRKVRRAVSNVLGLASPLGFAMSQTAQMDMLLHGEMCSDGSGTGSRGVWEAFREAVRQGIIVPVGAMWVEPDGNLLSGESWVRQMLESRAWFLEHLVCHSPGGARYLPGGGHAPRDIDSPDTTVGGVAWLPDTFGMNTEALPQILSLSGLDCFLSQKLSWSLVHKHPHTTFHWRSPSGERVLASFPPADSYNTKARAQDVLRSVSGNKDSGRCDTTCLLYGHGDGGGGPSGPMVESLTRLERVSMDGFPRTLWRGVSPAQFFAAAREEVRSSRAGASTWDGEMYLELHQGCFTSIPALKRAHQRAAQALLHTAEAAACLFIAGGGSTTKALAVVSKLRPHVRRLLVSQFHDILPGTSIALANQVALRWLNDGREAAVSAIEHDLFNEGAESSGRALLNCHPFSVCDPETQQVVPPLSVVRAAPDKLAPWRLLEDSMAITNGEDTLQVVHSEDRPAVRIHGSGKMGRLAERATRGGSFHTLLLSTDQPWYWDAWDTMPDRSERTVDLFEGVRWETGGGCVPCEGAHVTRSEEGFLFSVGGDATGRISCETVPGLDAVVRFRVEWPSGMHFRGKRDSLRASLRFQGLGPNPLTAFDTAFSTTYRPSTVRTAREDMTYEVPAHRWVSLSSSPNSSSVGVLVATVGKHGFEVRGNNVLVTLDRRVEAPDPGPHLTGECVYAVAFFQGPLDPRWARRVAASIDPDFAPISVSVSPSLLTDGSLFGVSGLDGDDVPLMIETVKTPMHPASAHIMVRLRETAGASTSFVLHTPPCLSVVAVDLMERPLADLRKVDPWWKIAPSEVKGGCEPPASALFKKLSATRWEWDVAAFGIVTALVQLEASDW